MRRTAASLLCTLGLAAPLAWGSDYGRLERTPSRAAAPVRWTELVDDPSPATVADALRRRMPDGAAFAAPAAPSAETGSQAPPPPFAGGGAAEPPREVLLDPRALDRLVQSVRSPQGGAAEATASSGKGAAPKAVDEPRPLDALAAAPGDFPGKDASVDEAVESSEPLAVFAPEGGCTPIEEETLVPTPGETLDPAGRGSGVPVAPPEEAARRRAWLAELGTPLERAWEHRDRDRLERLGASPRVSAAAPLPPPAGVFGPAPLPAAPSSAKAAPAAAAPAESDAGWTGAPRPAPAVPGADDGAAAPSLGAGRRSSSSRRNAAAQPQDKGGAEAPPTSAQLSARIGAEDATPLVEADVAAVSDPLCTRRDEGFSEVGGESLRSPQPTSVKILLDAEAADAPRKHVSASAPKAGDAAPAEGPDGGGADATRPAEAEESPAASNAGDGAARPAAGGSSRRGGKAKVVVAEPTPAPPIEAVLESEGSSADTSEADWEAIRRWERGSSKAAPAEPLSRSILRSRPAAPTTPIVASLSREQLRARGSAGSAPQPADAPPTSFSRESLRTRGAGSR